MKGGPSDRRQVSWAREKAFQVLNAWSGRERRVPLRRRITTILDRSRRDPRDKALFWQLVLGVVRNLRLLDGVAKIFVRRLPPPGPTRQALRIGLYQLLFLDRVPPHAAVSESVDLVGRRHDRGLVNAVLRRTVEALGEGEATDPTSQLALPGGRRFAPGRPFLPHPEQRRAAYLGVRHSYPDFLVRRWGRRWGWEEAERIMVAGNTTPLLNLRVNRLKATVAEAEASLRAQGVERLEAGERPGTLRLDWPGNPAGLAALREGLVSVQDPAAMEAVCRARLEPGLRVLDLCSAPGGKTTQAAEMMGDEGAVFAWDADFHRLERTEQAARRLELASVKVLYGLTLEEVLELGPYDRVLADVPCTSTGVLAKRPEARWKLAPRDFVKLPAIQARILEQACRALVPGGCLVYSTCSLEPEENEGVVARAEGWRVDFQQTTLPRGGVKDGSFVARLVKA